MSMKSIIWNLIKRMSNLSFSICMLLLIASTSVIGTIIEQDQSVAYYQFTYPEDRPLFFLFTWKSVLGLGLDHLYSNYLFFLILFLFFLSLIMCTFSTQLPILRQARRWKFLYNKVSLSSMMYSDSYVYNSFINFTYLLNIKRYYVFHRGQALYAYKGLLGRLAPIFVHLSIILTFIGFLVSVSGSFFAQEIVPLGEFFHVQNVVKAGSLSVLPKNIYGKVNDFYIDYSKDGSIRQFFSNISILDNSGSILYSNNLSVNYPLNFKGLIFYQTDWHINALRIQLGFNPLLEKVLTKVAAKSKQSAYWLCRYKISEKHQISILISDLNDKISLYDETGHLINDTRYGVWNIIYGVPVLIKDTVSSTGLQIKIDPGVYVAYLGFFLLMLNILLSYMSYSQIWVNYTFDKLYCSGRTNRAYLAFEDETAQINQLYLFLIKNPEIGNC